MSRTVRGSLGSSRVGHHEDEERDERSSSGRKKRNVERKPTFLSFFKVCSFMHFLGKLGHIYSNGYFRVEIVQFHELFSV